MNLLINESIKKNKKTFAKRLFCLKADKWSEKTSKQIIHNIYIYKTIKINERRTLELLFLRSLNKLENL
jgi:hypothetical protein